MLFTLEITMDKNLMELFPDRPAGSPVDLQIANSATTFVWCPAGEFVMGGPSSELSLPQHSAVLTTGFWFGQTQITREFWEAVMNDDLGPCDRRYGARVPIEGLSWTTAVDFCDTLTQLLKATGLVKSTQRITLPTEAQWEYACRAGTQTNWYFGDDEVNLAEHAWYRNNSEGQVHAAGLKGANPWGIYDLYGNVAEWCLDNFYAYRSSKAVDPCFVESESNLRIARGGAYTHLAKECRSASREGILETNPFGEATGLRLVCVDAAYVID
jgi:formylglycine-generating enzyme required for sulfatase activity